MKEGQSHYDLGVGLARLEADAANIQSEKEQKFGYVNEQRRDVSNMLIYLAILAIIGLNLQTLFSKNLAFSIISIPFFILIVVICLKRVNSRSLREKSREEQFKEFNATKENNDARN